MNIRQLNALEDEFDERAWDYGLDIEHEGHAGVPDDDLDDKLVHWEHLHTMLTAVRIAKRAWFETECLYPDYGPCTCPGADQ